MSGLIMIVRWSLTVILLLITSTVWTTPLSSLELWQRKEVPMGVSNGIVTAPVNPQEVYKLLGVGKYNGWWDNGYICKGDHGKTNMWAKYKPFRYPLTSDPTEEQRIYRRYGVNVPMVDTYNLGKDIVWTYAAPSGGNTEPYRLDDFIGYKHDSTPSIEIQIPDKIYVNKEDSMRYVYMLFDDYASTYTPGSLKVTEIFQSNGANSWYPGVLVHHPTKGTIWRTSTKKLSEFTEEDWVEIPVRPTWEQGEIINVYAVLSQFSFTGDVGDTPPIDAESMFYLEYEQGAGHKSILLDKFNFILNYVTVTSLNIYYDKNTSGNTPFYNIYSMNGMVKNEYGGALQFTMDIELDEEETGSVYTFGSKSIYVAGNSSQAFSVDAEENLHLPANIHVYEILIRAVRSSNDAANIFTRKFNFETGKWV